MKFDDLDKTMRVFETTNDPCVLPCVFIVVRLDGRNFTRLTKDVHDFEAPFDERFRDVMVATTMGLMDCGFRTVYGYTQSDEISILLSRDDETFGRKVRKIVSVLAGEASARVSLALGDRAVFDGRISQLPDIARVVEYFRWRQEDAHRNALNGHCYWLLRRQGLSAQRATKRLVGTSVGDKNELLFRNGVNFAALPAWQRRGVGVVWEEYEKSAENPKTGEAVTATRRRLCADMQIPMKDAYERFVRDVMERSDPALGADTQRGATLGGP